MAISGDGYAKLVASYLLKNFSERGIRLFREVKVGKSIIGKNRIVDIFCLEESSGKALAIECKYQSTMGTVDEKIPYALQDLEAMRMPGVIVYAGTGFSDGVLQMLKAHRLAAYCLPEAPDCAPSKTTRELDHILAQTFGWWDLLLKDNSQFRMPRNESLLPLRAAWDAREPTRKLARS